MDYGMLVFGIVVAFLVVVVFLFGGVGPDVDLYKYCVYKGKMFDEKSKEWVSPDEWSRRNNETRKS